MLRWDDQSVKKIVDNGKWCESSLSERLDVKKNCFIKDCDKNSATNLTSLIDEVRQNPFSWITSCWAFRETPGTTNDISPVTDWK